MSVVDEIERRGRREQLRKRSQRPKRRKEPVVVEPEPTWMNDSDLFAGMILKLVQSIRDEQVRKEREWDELPTEIKVLLDPSIPHSAFCP